MANKVGPKEVKRIQQLKAQGLTDEIVAIRMGITERTVRIYTRAARENHKPYHPTEKLDCTTPE